MKRISSLSWVLIAILGAHPLLAAEKGTTSQTAHKPIVTQWTTMDGIKYFYMGQKVLSGKQLNDIIRPLNDPECNRLLDLSASSEDTAVVLLVGGSTIALGGLILDVVGPNDGQIDTQEAIGICLGLAGLVVDYVGIFKLAESHTSKFTAIQRYNAVLHGDDLSFLTLPKRGFQAELLTFKF